MPFSKDASKKRLRKKLGEDRLRKELKNKQQDCAHCSYWTGLLALGQCMLPGSEDEPCKDTWSADVCNNWTSLALKEVVG